MDLLMFVLTAIAAGLGAYFGAYLKKRAENQATKEDFDQLMDQLRTTTQVAQQVVADVQHQDWAAREWKALRLKKLEELADAATEMNDWWQRVAWEVSKPDRNLDTPAAARKFSTLSRLYFPELRLEADALTSAFDEAVIAAIQCNIDVRAEQVYSNEHYAQRPNGLQEMKADLDRQKAAIRIAMQRIPEVSRPVAASLELLRRRLPGMVLAVRQG